MKWTILKVQSRNRDCLYLSINKNRIYFSTLFTKEVIFKKSLLSVNFVQADNFKYVGFEFSEDADFLLHFRGGMAVIHCTVLIDKLNLDFNKKSTYQFLLSYDTNSDIWFFKLK